MKKIIATKNAPSAIGPYSQAVLVNGMLFTSGQIAINPETGNVEAKTVEEQTVQVLKNITAILESEKFTLDDVFKTTIFLKNMEDFSKINSIYGDFFNGDKLPARSTVEVARLPKDVLIEIEVIATK